ncbi:helix-turn-helix domain-containing protein, partial [Cloacibacillus porcorum]|uniref:helix-turn-helix domain-containing protein n=1 Tax=Cloacibacillus porcorum TaxID=1197717 RepID=UPI0023F3E9A2
MRKRNTEERIRAIEMHKPGIPRRRSAEELGVSPDSVKTWISLYKSGQKDLLDDTRKKRTYSKAVKLEAVSA